MPATTHSPVLLGDIPAPLRLTGSPGPVAAASRTLLSTGGWSLAAEGRDGPTQYAELVPGPDAVAGAGAAVAGAGPDAGVMVL